MQIGRSPAGSHATSWLLELVCKESVFESPRHGETVKTGWANPALTVGPLRDAKRAHPVPIDPAFVVAPTGALLRHPPEPVTRWRKKHRSPNEDNGNGR